MPSRPLPDLTPREFRDAVAELGFAYLGGSVDKFVDRKFRKAGQYIDMVRGERRRPRYAATLAALKAARSAAERASAALEAERARKAKIAATLAPVALPADRASLQGEAAIHQLAEDFRTIATRSEGVTWRDLMVLGWQPAQITEHTEAARQLGYARENGVAA